MHLLFGGAAGKRAAKGDGRAAMAPQRGGHDEKGGKPRGGDEGVEEHVDHFGSSRSGWTHPVG